jgi:hypothetical protein
MYFLGPWKAHAPGEANSSRAAPVGKPATGPTPQPETLAEQVAWPREVPFS